MSVTLDELQVGDRPEDWQAAGFDVDADGVCRVGGVRLRFVGTEAGRGLVGWSLGGWAPAGSGPGDVDGLATGPSEGSEGSEGSESAHPIIHPTTHPIGVTAIDHVVVLTPDLTRTVAVWRALGVEPRRERDGELGGVAMRQVFFRLGSTILEVVGSAEATGDGPSTLWGVTFTVADIDATATRLGERTSPVKDAVQPGRRITTLRHRDLGLSVRTALISPPPPRS